MKHLTTYLSLTALLAAALAAPGAAVAEEVADDNLSHINGQLVPVGVHNEYKLSYPRINLSTNPLGALLGLYGVSGAYAVHANVAVRADVNYFAPIDEDETGYELGLSAPIYFRRVWTGVFLEPGLVVRSYDSPGQDGEPDASATLYGFQTLVGWHWVWDSGLNVAVAAGVGRNFNAGEDESEAFGNGYLRFGYAF